MTSNSLSKTKINKYALLALNSLVVLLLIYFVTNSNVSHQSNTPSSNLTFSYTQVLGTTSINPVIDTLNPDIRKQLTFPLINVDTTKVSGELAARSCTSSSVTQIKKLPANQKPITTLQISIPSWTWLNSNNYLGTANISPFSPPCVVDMKEDSLADKNFANQFNTNANLLIGSSTIPISIPGNGISCLNYEQRSYLDAVSTTFETTKYGSSQSLSGTAEKTAIENAINAPYLTTGTLQSFASKTTAFDNASTDKNTQRCVASRKIDYLYKEDKYTSPEFQYANAPDLNTLTGIDIPYANIALKKAYDEESYKLSLLSYTNNRIIHRNRAGIKVTLTKNYYSADTTNNFTAPDFKEYLQSIPTDSQPQLPGIYQPNKTPIGVEQKDFYFPWLGQLRQIYLRLTVVLSDNQDIFFSPNNLYTKTLSPLIDFISSKNGLDAEVAVGTNPKDRLGSLLKKSLDETHLYYCSDIDKAAVRMREYIPTLSTAQQKELDEIINSIAQTDCIGQVNIMNDEIDPLETYLCNRGLLAADICKGQPVDPVDSSFPGLAPTPTPVSYPTNPTNPEPPVTCTKPNDPITLTDNLLSPVVSGGFITQAIHSSHPGVDWGVGVGTKLQAIGNNCKVVFAGETNSTSQANYSMWNSGNSTCTAYSTGTTYSVSGGFFRAVLLACPLSDGSTVYPAYAHLSSIPSNIVAGAVLNKGDIIGYSGNAGNSCGPHLHFELRKKGGYVPYRYTGSSDPNYYDPQCLFFGNCNIKSSTQATTTNQSVSCTTNSGSASSSNTTSTPSTYTSTPANDLGLPTSISQITRKYNAVTDVVNPKLCPSVYNNANYHTEEDLALINLASTKGNTTGVRNSGDILNLIKKIAENTCVPAEKIAAHVHGEAFGVNAPNKQLSEYYNGNIDQTYYSKPNECGAVGAGQFVPGTAKNFFIPGSTHFYYNAVRDCMISIGYTKSDLYDANNNPKIINPALIGAGICAMGVYLHSASGMGQVACQNWQDAAICTSYSDQEIRDNKSSCPLRAASNAYSGGCNSSSVFTKYCNETSLLSDPNTLISRYKQEFANRSKQS